MKRGFLNQAKAKKLFDSLSNDASNDNSEGTQVPATPPRSDSPPILDLHSIPASLVRDGRKRAVFRWWPRNPDGPTMVVSPRGKEAPNGLPLWGKTLCDFYRLNRMPTNHNYVTTSTGSKLAAYMREIGELDWAAPEIQWADQEKDPEQVFPCDIGKLVEDQETRVSMGLCGKPFNSLVSTQLQGESDSSCGPAQPNNSVFHPSNYPPPWPLVPFSTKTERLQKRIPFHLLPRKLFVHDPWNLLSVPAYVTREPEIDWTAKDDIIRTYHLQLSEAAKAPAENARDDGNNEEPASTIFFTRETDIPGPSPPPVMVSIPPRPPPPNVVPEAHLYILPSHRCGSGNHSVVYHAEWELPRSLLVDDMLCHACIAEKVAENLRQRQQMHDPHEVASEGPLDTSATGTISFVDEHIPAVTAELIHREFKSENHVAERSENQGEDQEGNDGEKDDTKNQDKGKAKSVFSGQIRTIEPARTVQTRTYEGPVLTVVPDVKWQNPERGSYCSHIQASRICKNVPLTAKVRVAAKLSIEYDEHLEKEAENYQSFPSHLFESWDGYNVMPPLHDPVPVSAVVPQFYGYYVPAQNQVNLSTPYLSPILLLEDCGTPIQPHKLSIDDKHECASLLFRLHEAGWYHGSFAPRNILVQDGPLSEWPVFRGLNDVRSFRLIDFGRSTPCASGSRGEEEMTALRLFHINGF